MLDKLLNEDEVAALTGRAASTLQKDRCTGGGIPFIKIGRMVRYRQTDVAAYLAALPAHRSTSELTAAQRRPARPDDHPEPPPAAA